MPLTPGSRLGPYEVISAIGAGGMGEVYKARDTKLNREVAIKVLPPAFAQDSERMARFQREAQVLAALNHPNIAQIYGMEGAALVMEFVPGENLQGPLPVDEAEAIARQIAEALEAAHEKGIVHRDLKPANVKVTPDGKVKVLDFGLAKAMEETSDISNSPTLSIAATRAGVILGTASYMSPEQAKGKSVDARADVWAYGCVYYELLAGRKAFPGDTAVEAMAAVISREPDWSLLPPGSPVELLRLCLRKDSKLRLRHIGDSTLISPAVTSPAAVVPPTLARRSHWPSALAATFALLSLVLLGLFWRATRHTPQPLLRLNVEPAPDVTLDASRSNAIALSPEGDRLLFIGKGSDGKTGFYTRLLDQPHATAIAGIDGSRPAFSPDGQWVVFFDAGKLKKVPVSGGAAVVLCDVTAGLGASWGDDGNIYFVPSTRSGVLKISSSGGTPAPVTELRKEKNEATHRWPQVAGQALLFTSHNSPGNYEDADIDIQSLKTGVRKTLIHGGYHGRYLPTGHLVYMREGTLFAAPMDLARMELTGESVPLLQDVASTPGNAASQFDFSRNGTFVYVPGRSASSNWKLFAVDAAGKTTPLGVSPGNYVGYRFSPDGKLLALVKREGLNVNLWVYDAARGAMPRLTFTTGFDGDPVWAPDGRHLAFASDRDARPGRNIYWVRADGSGEPIRLTASPNRQRPASFSPDGKRLAFTESGQIWTLPLDLSDPDHPHAGKPELFPVTVVVENAPPMFSPDGRWLAYVSNDSGINEVIVRPFPVSSAGGKWQVSTGGGGYPLWTKSGRELFYLSAGGAVQVMQVTYSVKDGAFVPDKPRVWLEKNPSNMSAIPPDLTPDGKRFVVLLPDTPVENKPSTHVTFLLNFFDELRRKAPGRN